MVANIVGGEAKSGDPQVCNSGADMKESGLAIDESEFVVGEDCVDGGVNGSAGIIEYAESYLFPDEDRAQWFVSAMHGDFSFLDVIFLSHKGDCDSCWGE